MINLWKSAGPIQVFRFLGQRVLRVQRHVVYRKNLTDIDEPRWGAENELHVVSTAEQAATQSAIACNLETRNAEYLEGMRQGEVIGLFVLKDGILAHWAFILTHTRTACLLGVDPEVPFVANAYTDPSFRGRGLQQSSLRQRLYECRRRGFREVYTETHPANLPSRTAMERVGMSFVREVTLIIFMSRFVIRVSHSGARARLFGWC